MNINDIPEKYKERPLSIYTIVLARPGMPRYNKQYFIEQDVAQRWAIYWMWESYYKGIVAEPLAVCKIGQNQWKNLDIENLIYGEPPYTFNHPLGPSEIEVRNNYLKYFYEEQLLDFCEEYLSEEDDPGELEEPNTQNNYPRYE